jgi:hypothetical protein
MDRTTTDVIDLTLVGTLIDTGDVFVDSPVLLMLSANQAGGSGSVGVVLTNRSGVTLSIPEPSTWVMMILGFGALGYAATRGRKTNIAMLSA